MERLYECTLYERQTYGDAHPVTIDGQTVSREIVALTSSKARYSYWLDLKDYGAKLQDIRVRSLAKRKAPPMDLGWEARLALCNSAIRIVGAHGRHFLSENSDRRELVADPFFAHFRADEVGELWYVDCYTRKPILVRHTNWPRFSDGGTLRSIVQAMSEYITGKRQTFPVGHFGPAPDWYSGGDPWGYGDDMKKVYDGILSLLAEAGR